MIAPHSPRSGALSSTAEAMRLIARCAGGNRTTPGSVLNFSRDEWHEGSEIEASVEYGSLLLDETAEFSKEFSPAASEAWLQAVVPPMTAGAGEH